MAKKYTRKEEKPLSDYLWERKDYYQKKFGKALDAVYNSKNFELIGSFEKLVLQLTTNAVKGKLESTVEATENETAKKTVDKRPRLTLYKYTKLRDSGFSNEEIKQKYKLDKPQQNSGFWRCYSKKKKK